jgi:uncharacterized membrane protein YvlD (DUF360 family)
VVSSADARRKVALGAGAVLVFDAIALLVLSEVFDDLTLDGAGAAIGMALVLGIANGLVFIAVAGLDLPSGTLILGAFFLVFNLAAITVAAALVPDAAIVVPGAVYIAVMIGLSTALLAWFFRSDEAANSASRASGSSRPQSSGR